MCSFVKRKGKRTLKEDYPTQAKAIAFTHQTKLLSQTRQAGLSLGDRACLSLGLRLGVPVLTSDHAVPRLWRDRVWASLNLSLEVRVIR